MGEVTAPQALPAPGAKRAKGQSFLRDLLRRLIRERPVGAVSGAVVLLLCLVAIFADLLAPYHFMDMTMIDRLKGPSGTYPLGTDHIGRDLFSRLLYGARVSLGVGFAATTLSVVVSLLIGGVAGFVGGKVDLAVQRLGRAESGHDAEPRGAAVHGDGAAAGDVAGGGADPVVYCLNMVGDALRDLLDPRLRGGGSLAGGVGARAAKWPYCKIGIVERELGCGRLTARRYLEKMTQLGSLERIRRGRENYYINRRFVDLLSE